MLEEIKAPILTELQEVEDEFRMLVKSNVPIINDIINHIAIYKGKRLRPILLLLCSGLTGGVSKDSIKAAAMVELLHTATLVHDDVIDGSDLRRGGPSVNSIWGTNQESGSDNHDVHDDQMDLRGRINSIAEWI